MAGIGQEEYKRRCLLQVGEDDLVRLAWDEASVDFLEQFAIPVYKIASASLTDDTCAHVRKTGKLSFSPLAEHYAEIDHAVEVLSKQDLILTHATAPTRRTTTS